MHLTIPSVLPLVLLAGITSCGIETTVGFFPPEERTIDRQFDRVVFEHNLVNATDPAGGFQGYELFYKIYDGSQTSRIDTDRDAILGGSGTARNALQTNGFQRLQTAGDRFDRPIVNLADRVGDPATVTLDFVGVPSQNGPFIRIEPNGAAPRELVRTVTDGAIGSADTERPFTDSTPPIYDGSRDADVDGDFDADAGLPLIVIYVLGYGIDPGLLSPVYSLDARFLNQFQL